MVGYLVELMDSLGYFANTKDYHQSQSHVTVSNLG